MRPSTSLWSKASRLPMTSKQGNKDFYKGTGPVPGLGPKSQGHFPFSKSKYVRDPAKARYFVAPEGWKAADGQIKGLYTSPLKPYVFSGARKSVPDDWPPAVYNKPEKDYNSLRKGIFAPQGFDGYYYLQLAEHFDGKSSS